MCEQAEQGLRSSPAHLRSYAGTLTQDDASWPVTTPVRFDGRPHSRGYSAKQSAAIAELSYPTYDQPAATILWGNSRGWLASSQATNYLSDSKDYGRGGGVGRGLGVGAIRGVGVGLGVGVAVTVAVAVGRCSSRCTWAGRRRWRRSAGLQDVALSASSRTT